MIVGQIANWKERFKGELWTTVFEALAALTPDSPEGKTSLQGEDIFLRVMSYATKQADDPKALCEAHRQYVDIQMVIAGSERIDWFPISADLKIKTPYDSTTDAQFYERPALPHASVDVWPGTFVVLFPEDIHQPQLVSAKGDAGVLKVVVKLKLSLIEKSYI